jgi:orotate phosphoribosyltransferase
VAVTPTTELSDLARRVGEACRLTGTFTLRSGQVSTTYFDKYLFEADPQLLRGLRCSPASSWAGCRWRPPSR